jgi:hypothetical protein
MDMPAWVFLDVTRLLTAWLVYRGELFSADQVGPEALSIWHTGRLRAATEHPRSSGAAYYQGEVAVENARASRYPDSTSRLRGFYVFPDRDTARRASATWDGGGFSLDTLTEVEIASTSRVSQYDAQWITRENLSTSDVAWIDRYLTGVAESEPPIWEWIVEGRAVIYGTDLREQARGVVLQEWPGSRPLLELARLGAWLGSDLGLITARAISKPNGIHVEHHMQFADATNAAFITRVLDLARDHPDQVDREALAELKDRDPVTPDLSPWNFVIPNA